MRKAVIIWFGLAVGSVSASGAGLEMGKCVEYPHAGVAMAVPKGFDCKQPGGAMDVMRAVFSKAGRPVQSVQLSAYAVPVETTAKDFSASRSQELSQLLAVRNMEVLKETSMPVAGLTGSAQRLRYTYRGEKVEAASVCFIRDLPARKFRLCYLLSVECDQEHKGALLRIVGETVKSVSLISVCHPMDIPVGPFGPVMEIRSSGYSFAPPIRWYVSRMGEDLVASQRDYLRPELHLDGLPVPQLRVIARPLSAFVDSKSSALECRDKLYQAIARHGSPVVAQVVSEGPAKLGGKDAYQFVILQKPAATTTTKSADSVATQPAKPAGESIVIAQRTMCTALAEKNMSYSLVLMCPTGDGSSADQLLNKLAEGFALMPSPASQPVATAPAEKK